MSQTSIRMLFAQKSWANSALFNALAAVSVDRHAAVVLAACRTLNHIHVVDRIFRAHLIGEAHGYTATNTQDTPALCDLQLAVAETDAWFERYTADVSRAQLDEAISFVFTDGDPAG